jgi:hypothetical protein
MPFVPFKDQIPGTCRDYFTIDDWVQYDTPEGRWLWVSHDAPLVTFGSHNVLARLDGPPENAHRVLAMLYNNIWVTNFVADSHGVFEFKFDMVYRTPEEPAVSPRALAATLQVEPTVVIHPDLPVSRLFLDYLHRP